MRKYRRAPIRMRSRFKITKENGIVRSSKRTRVKTFHFNITHHNKQKPTKGQTHVHITQQRITFIYFTMNKAFEKYLFQCRKRFTRKESIRYFLPFSFFYFYY